MSAFDVKDLSRLGYSLYFWITTICPIAGDDRDRSLLEAVDPRVRSKMAWFRLPVETWCKKVV
jgi:hypothetical protein